MAMEQMKTKDFHIKELEKGSKYLPETMVEQENDDEESAGLFFRR